MNCVATLGAAKPSPLSLMENFDTTSEWNRCKVLNYINNRALTL